MNPPVKGPVKRKYDSSRRQAQARETQGSIAMAAGDLFIERGYAATSIRDIADAAGVSVQTVYNAFEGGKAAIMSRVIDIAVVGDDEPIALADREEVQATTVSPDPRAVIEGWAGYVTGIVVRMMPVYPSLVEAGSIEPSLAELRQRNYVEYRWLGTREVAAHLHELGPLPAAFSVDRAADVMYACGNVESAIALIGERGWSHAQFEEWLVELFCTLFEID